MLSYQKEKNYMNEFMDERGNTTADTIIKFR